VPKPITIPTEVKHKPEFLPSFAALPSGEVRMRAGSTVQRVTMDKLGANTWCRVPASSFHVRCGENYSKNKKKDRSATFMFSCLGVDVFATPTKVKHIARHIQLPVIDANKDYEDPEEIGETALESPMSVKAKADGKATPGAAAADEKVAAGYDRIPQWLILHFQIPNYEPGNPLWGSTREDGPGHSVVFYFSLRPWAREELKKTNAMASAKLLRKWFNAPLDGFDEYRKRLKAIPRLANVPELNIGVAVKALVTQYNAKPFMTGPRCHTMIPGENYLEVDVDVHRFCYLARKGAYGLMDGMHKSVIDFALVVEAQSDEEMPEQVLGCCRMSKIDVGICRSLDYWLKHSLTAHSAPSTPLTSPSPEEKEKERKEDGSLRAYSSAPVSPAVPDFSPAPSPSPAPAPSPVPSPAPAVAAASPVPESPSQSPPA